MASTHPEVSDPREGEHGLSPAQAAFCLDVTARTVEEAVRRLGGRWKLLILFHLFGSPSLRPAQLERGIAGISQKMLLQQLRELERDGIVQRTVHAEVPPRVDYSLTAHGRALHPALRALLAWVEGREAPGGP